ncbi:hypothetical protein FNV43_RR14817 [Rhamnella rubrinervis]|uniref:Glycosyltransferase n=1 Tax=Rhamnella rubrinervis TaxID=2594499 RepID=A0A8K0H3V9_9ROSA|nr:hypothetical protein FNV43_RR14817 [Rhamnella rubrinervis]
MSDPYMGSREVADQKPHVVCIPAPGQSHIKAMLKLAKLLHHSGFHITFVNTEFNHNRYLQALGQNSLNDLPPGFQFKTIGLPPSSEQNTISRVDSVKRQMYVPFCELIRELNDQSVVNSNASPLVTHIVSDGFTSFTIKAGDELGIPVVLFFTISASVLMANEQLPALVEKLTLPPTRDDEITNGLLDTVIDWIPGMKDMRLRDLPSFCWTASTRDHILFNFSMEATATAHKASAIIIHTFYALEHDILDALSSMFPRVFSIGPLELLLNRMPEDPLKLVKYSPWKEESECLQWLDTKAPNSVVYVNFGSVTVMSQQKLVEFGFGLANSKKPFLWIIRADLVEGKSAILPQDFVIETQDRGLIASWCPQEEVLNHPSIGGFLTHSGWNSTIESLSSGVPMICWPFFGDQTTNCRYCCKEWGVGMEIDKDVKRDEVEKLVRELMGGEKGKQMKKNGKEWKRLAEVATRSPNGSSIKDMDDLVRHLLSL